MADALLPSMLSSTENANTDVQGIKVGRKRENNQKQNVHFSLDMSMLRGILFMLLPLHEIVERSL